jgi:hypothetical protein
MKQGVRHLIGYCLNAALMPLLRNWRGAVQRRTTGSVASTPRATHPRTGARIAKLKAENNRLRQEKPTPRAASHDLPTATRRA